MNIKNNRRLIITGIVFLPVIAAAVAFPFFARAREEARRDSCKNNLKQIAMAMAQYAKDNDDRLPPVALHTSYEVRRKRRAWTKAMNSGGKQYPISPFGWCDALWPYSGGIGHLHCPSDSGINERSGWEPDPGWTSYWLNSRVAGKRRSTLNSSTTIMNGDGTSWLSSNARYAISGPPANLTPEATNQDGTTQPPWPQRHLGGANYSFVDGHIKWLKPEEISTAPGADFTFSP